MSRRGAVILLAVGGLLAVTAGGFRTVHPGEQMVVRRFGRLLEPAWGPGPHLGLPLGIDRFERVRTDQVRRLVVSSEDPIADPWAGEFLTGDLNLMQVRAVVQYRIASPGDWLVRSASAEGLLDRLAGTTLTAALARRGIDAALREARPEIGAEVARALGEAALRHRLGVEILAVSLTDARPPPEVAADFAAAQAGESLRDRRRHEARTRADSTVAAASARATAIVESARANAQRAVLTARAQAQRFLSVLEPAREARELTERRMYLDAMQSLLGRVGRSIVVPAGDAVDLTVLGLDD